MYYLSPSSEAIRLDVSCSIAVSGEGTDLNPKPLNSDFEDQLNSIYEKFN